jgi:hypothetical protein
VAQITKVRTEQPPGYSHEHIAEVELSDGTREMRSTVISNINRGKHYWTSGGGMVADVIVAGCPICYSGNYITTAPDTTTANNLLHLRRFYY